MDREVYLDKELWYAGVCRVKYCPYYNRGDNLCNDGMHEGYGYIRRAEARRLIRSSVSLCVSLVALLSPKQATSKVVGGGGNVDRNKNTGAYIFIS